MLAVGLVKWSQGRPMSGLGVLSREGGFEDSRRVCKGQAIKRVRCWMVRG